MLSIRRRSVQLTRLKPGIFHCAGVLLAFTAPACLPVATLAQTQASDAEVNEGMARLDTFLASNAMYQAMKRVEPKKCEELRQKIRARFKAGTTQRELDKIFANFSQEFMDRRLRHGSPATLKSYIRLRVHFFEVLYSLSTDALYEFIFSGTFDIDKIPEKSLAALYKYMEEFYNEFASVIVAPLSDTPLRQDNDFIEQRLSEIRSKLTNAELEVLDKGGKADVNKAAYCKATLHLYREALKLPEAEVVQFFRFLDLLPKDDRSPK